MITVTLSIAAFVAISTMGYFTYVYREKARSNEAKYKAIKEFADTAASRIIKLETNNAILATHIRTDKVQETVATPQEPVSAITTKKFRKRRSPRNKKD